MIIVNRKPDENSQKVTSNFLKRVKKFNLVARKRKTQVRVKALSHLQKKKKAVMTANYLAKKELFDRIGKGKL
jgi:hypothetical protein